jgi:hypothetical protein
VLRRTSAVVLACAIAACSSFSSTNDAVAPPDAASDAALDASVPDAPRDAPTPDAADETFPGCTLLVTDAFPPSGQDPRWTLAGDARFGQRAVVLTEDTPYKRGAVFLSTGSEATALHVRFDLRFEHANDDGGQERGDGLSFFWANDKTFTLSNDGFGVCNANGYAFVVSSTDFAMDLHDTQDCNAGIGQTPNSFPLGQAQAVSIDITQADVVAKLASHQFSSTLSRAIATNTVGFTGITGGYTCRHTVTNIKIWVCP